MNNLDDLYLFKCVVDSKGISAASRRLGIAKSTLSRRINALEAHLGVRLFHHGPRQFQLTHFGQFCYDRCEVLLQQAEQIYAMAEQLREHPAGRLHVICPPMIGALMIEDIAAGFARIAPDVYLHLEETTGAYDPRHLQADVVIYPTFKPLIDSTLVARRIFTAAYMLAAHPDVLAEKPAPGHPRELAAFSCIGLGARTGDWVWDLKHAQQRYGFRFKPAFTTTQPTALLRAARQGLGIASLPVILCQEALLEGALVPVLADWQPEPVTIYALYPASRGLTAAARAFLQLLVERTRNFDRA